MEDEAASIEAIRRTADETFQLLDAMEARGCRKPIRVRYGS